MAAALLDQFTVGNSDAFQSRVQPAMVRHSQFRVESGDDAQGFASLGKQIMSSPESYVSRFSQVVATMPDLDAAIASSPTDGSDVTDTQILTAVETVYPSFAR